MIFIDDLRREVVLEKPPQRIISLVPSQTELLHYLGLEKELVGITKFCVHPSAWSSSKTKIGGTKNIHLQKAISLQPDLIVANKEENNREQIEAFAALFPVWISDVNNLSDACRMIENLGIITAKKIAAASLVEQISQGFTQLKSVIETERPRVCYLIWKDPYMTAGGDTFISNMLQHAGFDNIFQQQKRYPEVDVTTIGDLGCDVLLLSSEPFPFRQKHVAEWQQQLPDTKIILVDGEMFSWYGSHLLQAPAYFASLHQQLKAFA